MSHFHLHFRFVALSFNHTSGGSSGRVRGWETWNLCGRLPWPSFYDLILQGQGDGAPSPPRPLPGSATAHFPCIKSNKVHGAIVHGPPRASSWFEVWKWTKIQNVQWIGIGNIPANPHHRLSRHVNIAISSIPRIPSVQPAISTATARRANR